MYGIGLTLIIIGGCFLDSKDLRIPVALILFGAGICLIKYIKLHRCNRRQLCRTKIIRIESCAGATGRRINAGCKSIEMSNESFSGSD
jgi:hypothetical protein